MPVTHERRGHIVRVVPQPAVVDKDGNETTPAVHQSFVTHDSVNAAKRFMRTLPPGTGRVTDKFKLEGQLHLHKKRGAK
jgi:hypothetical protein